MNFPLCPRCNENLTFLQGLKFFNPWKIECPHCRTHIQANFIYKALTITSPFLAGAIVGLTIYFEEIGKWETKDSVLFLFIVISALFIISYKTWPLIKFLQKENEK